MVEATNKVVELKVIVLGDYGVGKSTVIYRLFSGKFDPNRKNVIGCDFMRKNVEIGDATYRLCLWDTAGQERFKLLTSVYYRNVCCVVLMFAVDNKDSFINLDTWLAEVMALSGITDPNTFPFVLIGNKSDLDAVVTQDDMAAWCANNYNMPYYLCSAKTGEKVMEAFTAVATRYASISPSAKADLTKATPTTAPPHICC